jgi:hypothetical protein
MANIRSEFKRAQLRVHVDQPSLFEAFHRTRQQVTRFRGRKDQARLTKEQSEEFSWDCPSWSQLTGSTRTATSAARSPASSGIPPQPSSLKVFPPPHFAQQSIGDWAACATCHAMIQGNETASLTARSLNFLCQKEPTYEPFREELYQGMFMLFRQFFEYRCGEPTPLRFDTVHPATRRVRHVQQQLPKTTKRRPLSQRSTSGGGTMREKFTDFCVLHNQTLR